MRKLKKLLSILGMALLLPVLLFEEWGWDPIARAMAGLARLRLWARVETLLRALPPWAAVLAFFVPVLMLLPVKLFGLFLLGEGHALSALLLLLAAKLFGTALLAWLFQLLEPALMRIPWFSRWYPRWKTWKDGVLMQVRGTRIWGMARSWTARIRRHWRRLREG
jgi:hypothetical protein